MALDRQSIEKKDFPIARRGYDPEAVDAHLERVAAEVESLRSELAAGGGAAPATAGAAPTPRSSPASLAIAASEQVRAIVEAAETSAAGIEAGAHAEADRIRREAEAAARATRDDAVDRSEDHVGAVGEATSLMLQRVDAMESEITALVESLRTGANRLGADLSLLQGNLGELYDAAGATAPPAAAEAPRAAAPKAAAPKATPPEPRPAPPEPAAEEPVRSLPPIPEEAPDPSPHVEAPIIPPGLFTPTEPVPPREERTGSVLDEPYADAAPAAEPAADAGTGGEADVDGARLIALNMALNGASREETDAYLRDNFDLPDRAALVAEAFATVEG
ncbi:DivIVA domain-containing protein [Paraconexibacter antarcticus]|uniref:DivIVA domain-containing protein n=1 Tax=Paraconexibacter antarcticus TaxID=2949664 RepID=A0ABY5DLU7_9ACTN|nr:DivIVA domain-containing protein [Paraconexibacter antarcticus]UTI62464.1 DivIVA domain-containing protein [Paraconexibacter antarcticus]